MDDQNCRCNNCKTLYTFDEIIPLDEVPHLLMRIEPGGIVPAGACPDTDCGALCYLEPSEKFVVAVAFGDEATLLARRQAYAKLQRSDAFELHEFDTETERQAFLDGVCAAEGWSCSHIFDDEEVDGLKAFSDRFERLKARKELVA